MSCFGRRTGDELAAVPTWGRCATGLAGRCTDQSAALADRDLSSRRPDCVLLLSARELKHDFGSPDEAELVACDALHGDRIFPKVLHPTAQVLNLLP